MNEYPAETAGLDGTGLTQAVCPKGHGKARTVSADALLAKGAPQFTFGLKCLEPLTKDAKAKDRTGSPVRSGEASANGTVHATNAPADPDLCQEALVPLESFDESGNEFRKNGKVTKEQQERTGPVATGGEKLAAASGTDLGKAGNARREKAAKAEKSRARGSRTPAQPKVDAKGGKGVTVAEEPA